MSFYHANTFPFDVDRLYGSIRKGSSSFAVKEIEIEDDFESSYGEDDSGYCYERDAIKELKGISDGMIRSGYEKERCHVRRDALYRCLSILGLRRLVLRKYIGLSVEVSGQIRHWYTSYLRSLWGKALLCFKDEGIGGGGGSSVLGFLILSVYTHMLCM
ncbi:putative exocyst complex component Exo70 [Helianthus debilis subsp. tardiflorus]